MPEPKVRLSSDGHLFLNLTSAKWLGLNAEVNVDSKLFLGLFQDGDHDLGSVVDGKDNILDTSLGSEEHSDRLALTRASIWCKLKGQCAALKGELTSWPGVTLWSDMGFLPCCRTRPEVWAMTTEISQTRAVSARG